MKTRIPLRTVELIKEFNPLVDANKLHIPLKTDENAFIFTSASSVFNKFSIFSDYTLFYIVFESTVLRFLIDIDDDYDFNLKRLLFNDFKNQTKYVDKNRKAAAISLFYNLTLGSGKHMFNQFFADLYKQKDISEIVFESTNNTARIYFKYLDETFDVQPVFDKGTLLVKFSLADHKFTRYYPLKKFIMKTFLLDFVNEKDHITESIDDIKDNFQAFITLRDMRNY